MFSNIGNAETGLGLWQEALKDFTYASSLAPDVTAPQIGRSLVLYELGRADESRAYFKALIEKYPTFPDGQAAYATVSSC